MSYTVPHYIDGHEVSGGLTENPIYNPATGEVIGRVELADKTFLDDAIASAKAAFASWSQVSLGRRTAIMFRFRELMKAATGELAEMITREEGKVLSDSVGEVGRALDVVEYVCGVPELLKGEFSMQASSDMDVFTFREPLGVCAGITPFNFPVMCPMWMVPVAIACGNTFVLKPAKADPSAAVHLAKLFTEAGLPPGVFNVVHGDRHAVAATVAHPDIRSLSFVGSTPVGRELHRIGTSSGKRVQAFAGAKNHGLVMSDANLDFAAASAVASAFGAAGERCMALPVILVESQIADQFTKLVVEKARTVKVSGGMEPDADMGPIVTRADLEYIESVVDDAVSAGATLLLDGRGYKPPGYENGFFTGPTILTDVSHDMRAYIEEIFGPVLLIEVVKDLGEAIEIIESNPYGNGAAIFTSSGDAARRFIRSVPVGMIGVNVPIPVPVAYHSFGGWQDSFFGEAKIYGPEGVAFFTESKVVSQRWLPPTTAPSATFHFSGASSAME